MYKTLTFNEREREGGRGRGERGRGREGGKEREREREGGRERGGQREGERGGEREGERGMEGERGREGEREREGGGGGGEVDRGKEGGGVCTGLSRLACSILRPLVLKTTCKMLNDLSGEVLAELKDLEIVSRTERSLWKLLAELKYLPVNCKQNRKISKGTC